jgi:DNA-binding PadR family transcriptional regulator
MHPYEMQRLIREWHKDEFLDLKPGSLYHAIERLRRVGWIDPVETSRAGRRPERTVYRLTSDGERAVLDWLGRLLAQPLREPNGFFAALSFLAQLTPAGVQQRLEERVERLEAEIAGLKTVLKTMVPQIGRLVLIEVEYTLAMRKAELAWVKSVIEELRAGALAWDTRRVLSGAAAETAQKVTKKQKTVIP